MLEADGIIDGRWWWVETLNDCFLSVLEGSSFGETVMLNEKVCLSILLDMLICIADGHIPPFTLLQFDLILPVKIKNRTKIIIILNISSL